MEPDIRFTHGGKNYLVPYAAYSEIDALIVLPDGTIVSVLEWGEIFPPIPKRIVIVDETFVGTAQADVVHTVGGIVATEIL